MVSIAIHKWDLSLHDTFSPPFKKREVVLVLGRLGRLATSPSDVAWAGVTVVSATVCVEVASPPSRRCAASLSARWCCRSASRAVMGRFSSIDVVLDYMGIIHPYITHGKRYRRIFFTIDYEGVIVISIGLLRREIARGPPPSLSNRKRPID